MGINPMNKITIIIRILFAVTLFQHSPLTRRVFFNSIRRERSASSVASGGQYRQYHLETLASTFTSHRKFSSSVMNIIYKMFNIIILERMPSSSASICISKNDTSSQH
jgi:hypothetical protein